MPRNTNDYKDRSNDYQDEEAEQYTVGPVLERDEWRTKWFDKEFTNELKALDGNHANIYQNQHNVLDVSREERLSYLADSVTAFNSVEFVNRDERWQAAAEVARETYNPIFRDLSRDEEQQLFADDRTLRYLLSLDKYRGYSSISCIDKGVDANGDPVRDYRINFNDPDQQKNVKLAQDLATDYGPAAYYTPSANMESQQMRYAQALFNSQEWEPAARDPQDRDWPREKQAVYELNAILEESRIHHDADSQERYVLIHGTAENIRWDDPLAAENTLKDKYTLADDVTTQMDYYDHPDHDAYRIAIAARYAFQREIVLNDYEGNDRETNYPPTLQKVQDDSEAFAKAALSGAGYIQAEGYEGPPDYYHVDSTQDITDQHNQYRQILEQLDIHTGAISHYDWQTANMLLLETSLIAEEATKLQYIQDIAEELRRAGDNLRAVNFMLQPVDPDAQEATRDMDLKDMLRGQLLETMGYQLRQPQMARSHPEPSQPLQPVTP